MAVKEIKDFSRGYATDLLPEDFPDNVLQAAENVYFDGKLRKRKGYKTFYTNATESSEIVGHYYCMIETYGVTIIALEVADEITFHSNYTGSFVEIDASFTWTGTGPVLFDVINEKVVLVDSAGVNSPAVIYYDSGMTIETLDEYDTRQIEDAFWFAGQYDDSAGTYTDDTTDAQSDTTSDFNITTDDADDGFYVSSAKVFSKVIMKTAEQMDGSPVAVYEYYDGSTWQTFTPGTAPTWTAAAGDRTIEFNIPEDWATWDGDDADDSTGATVPASMTGMYILRVTFSTAPTAAVDCAYIEVWNTRAVTYALFNDIPTDVIVHNSRVFLVTANSISYGLYGLASGFEQYYAEYFSKGGPTIRKAVSMNGALYIVKDSAIHRMAGTYPEDFNIEIVANRGTSDGNTCAVVKEYLCFSDGEQLFVFTGSNLIEVSPHLRSEIPTTGYGASSGGYYWLIASDKILRFDPDNIKTMPNSEYHAAVYKYTNSYTVKGIIRYTGTNKFADTSLKDRIVGYISGQPSLICMEYGTQAFDQTDTTIPVKLETKMYSFGVQTQKKIYKRVKPLVSQSGTWTFTVQTDRDADTVAVTLASGTGGTYYQQEISLPYTVDSDTLSFKLENNTIVDCTVYGISLELDLRPY